MNILYWSAAIPQLTSILFNELRRSVSNTKLTLQIHPDEKTILFNDARADEILRCDSFETAQIKKWLSTTKGKRVVIVDLWAAVFRKDYIDFVKDLNAVLTFADYAVVLLPKPWTGVFRHSLIFKNADERARTFFEGGFHKVSETFELFWNTSSQTMLLTFAPPFALVEELSGRAGLVPHRFLGMNFLPNECKKSNALFSIPGTLAKEILLHIGVIPSASSNASWTKTSDSDVRYFAGFHEKRGVQSDRPPNKGFLLSCTWNRYVQLQKDSPLINELARANCSISQVVRWFYFQASLAAETQNISASCANLAKHLFDSPTSLQENQKN